MSNQSAAPSINSLERASKKSSKRQKVNKISKFFLGEFEYFGGSDVANKLMIEIMLWIWFAKKRIATQLLIKKTRKWLKLRDSEISHEKWQLLNYRIYYHSIFVTIIKLVSKLQNMTLVSLGISYFYPKTLVIFSVKIFRQ